MSPLGFSSEYRDEELGLIYYNYRHYNPGSGRWISKDPANDGANMYRMVGNNPVNFTDVLGLWQKDHPESKFYCAKEETDTLETLATEVGSSKEDWSYLWPSLHTKDHGYASKKVKKDDLYTIENLDESEGRNIQIKFSNKFIDFSKAVLINPSNVANYIKNKSNEGGSPISYLAIAGHGDHTDSMSMKIKGVQQYFTLSDLINLNKKPAFDRAIQKKGPLRCWFKRNAKAIFSGCETKTIAQPFAEKILRKGAIAQGTDQDVSITMKNGKVMINYSATYNPDGAFLGFLEEGEFDNAKVWNFFDGKQ